MQGSKVKYTKAQKRQAEHIALGYRKKGVSARMSKQRAWATVNKMSGGGKKSGSGRGKSISELNKRKKSVASSSVASRKGSPLKRTTGSLSRGHKRSTVSSSSRVHGGKRSTSSSSSRSVGGRKRSTSSSKSRIQGGRKRSTKVSGSRSNTKKRSTTGGSIRNRKRSTLTSRTSPRKVGRTASSRGHKSVRSVSSRRRSINGFAHRK